MVGKHINPKGRRKKIAFCFLTYEGHERNDIWVNNIKQSKNNHYFNFYVHNKNEIPEGDFLKPYEIPDKIPTAWSEISLVRATLLLFKEAFKDPDNYYFILLSDKCIPLYSLDYIYDLICTSNQSILDAQFGYNPTTDRVMQRRVDAIIDYIETVDNFSKCSQWMCLTRMDVRFLLENDDTEHFEDCYCADEHYFCNVLSKHKRDFISMKFMYANWLCHSDNAEDFGGDERNFPKTYHTLSSQQFDTARDSGALFMRKIISKCVICYKVLSKIYDYGKKD